jgi:hypothetical protein
MFKHNREKRYNELIESGFMGFEARWLSMIPFAKHPAMQVIITRRRKLLARRIKEANAHGWSRAKRLLVWNVRTRKMYQSRHWIAHSDHPTGMGPRAGEPDPFELYRRCERSEISPAPGDSRQPPDHHSDTERRWELDRGQILLLGARQARGHGERDKYRQAINELDEIINNLSGKKKEMLTAARNKL